MLLLEDIIVGYDNSKTKDYSTSNVLLTEDCIARILLSLDVNPLLMITISIITDLNKSQRHRWLRSDDRWKHTFDSIARHSDIASSHSFHDVRGHT